MATLRPDTTVSMLPDGSVRVSSPGQRDAVWPRGSAEAWDYVTIARRWLTPVQPVKLEIFVEYNDDDIGTGRRGDH